MHGAEQRNDEDGISWSCRLEDIMGRARDMGAIHPSEVKRMLHIFWNGLRKDLKDASGHKCDSIKWMYVDIWTVVVQLFVVVCYIVVVVVVVTGSSVLVVYMCLYILVDNISYIRGN
jgi:hypothetical protein